MKNNFLLFFILLFFLITRLYQIESVPASLYWDEASLGYNAYAILTTGHDEHGERFPITRFIAFGDYKPPGYIYAAVPAIFLFGLTEFAVRFPSAVSGILMVVLTYVLVLKLFSNQKAALLSSLLLAISPWSLQLSRAAFEAHLAAMLNLAGITSFVYCRKKKWLFLNRD